MLMIFFPGTIIYENFHNIHGIITNYFTFYVREKSYKYINKYKKKNVQKILVKNLATKNYDVGPLTTNLPTFSWPVIHNWRHKISAKDLASIFHSYILFPSEICVLF